MMRPVYLIVVLTLLLAACAPAPNDVVTTRTASANDTSVRLYRIKRGDVDRIQFRMLDSVNSLRAASGLQQVTLNGKLNAAASTHSRDMSVQNRPWHFGSDGSSPLDRVQRAGYVGVLIGEVISETYESETETLAAWMDEVGTREVLMDPRAAQMGFSWFQESNGKIWWTLVLGE